jgi:hypothetical protein
MLADHIVTMRGKPACQIRSKLTTSKHAPVSKGLLWNPYIGQIINKIPISSTFQ